MADDEEVLAALEVLRRAGWTVRRNVTHGKQVGDLILSTYGQPGGKTYESISAMTPWREVSDG